MKVKNSCIFPVLGGFFTLRPFEDLMGDVDEFDMPRSWNAYQGRSKPNFMSIEQTVSA